MLIAHTVHVDAAPQKVWDVVIDVERWPEFGPQFRSIQRKDQGPLAAGSTARVTPHGFLGSVWTVMRFEVGRSFAWEADALPGVHLAADHLVEPAGGGANLTLSLESSGPLAPLVMIALGRIFRRNTRQEAEGIKAFCEGSEP